MKTILVTGAAGFLGRAFVRHHIAAGDHVLGVDDLSSEHARWPDELLDEYRILGDVCSFFEQWDGTFDLAYHFAAPVGGRIKIEGDPLYNADSLRLDAGFFRWAPKRVLQAVYPSSSAVYGVQMQGEHGHALQEGMFHPQNPNWMAPDEMYGFTKLAGEMLAWKAEKYGLSTLCIRPFSGYGPEQGLEYPVPAICLRAKNHEDPLYVWGSGNQSRDFVFIDDLVEAVVARLYGGVSGYASMNIGSGFPVSFSNVAVTAAKIAGYEPTIRTDELQPQGVLKRWADTGRMNRYYTPQVGLTEGLRRVMEAL